MYQQGYDSVVLAGRPWTILYGCRCILQFSTTVMKRHISQMNFGLVRLRVLEYLRDFRKYNPEERSSSYVAGQHRFAT